MRVSICHKPLFDANQEKMTDFKADPLELTSLPLLRIRQIDGLDFKLSLNYNGKVVFNITMLCSHCMQYYLLFNESQGTVTSAND